MFIGISNYLFGTVLGVSGSDVLSNNVNDFLYLVIYGYCGIFKVFYFYIFLSWRMSIFFENISLILLIIVLVRDFFIWEWL